MKIKIIILFLIIITLSGCWEYKELDDFNLISGIGVDYDNKSKTYLITLQILNITRPESEGSAGGAEAKLPFATYDAKGKTILEAINKVVLTIPKEPYLGHLEVVLIGEQTAKNGLYDVLDFFLREKRARKIFPLIIVKGSTANEALKITSALEDYPAKDLVTSLKYISYLSGSASSVSTFDKVVDYILQEGRNTSFNAIKIVGKPKKGETAKNVKTAEPQTKIKIIGNAVFKDDKLVGFFKEKESLGYQILRQRIKKFTLSFPCDKKKNYASISVDKLKFNRKVDIKKGIPHASFNVEIEGSLNEINCSYDLKKTKNLKKIEKMADKELKRIINKTIKATQKEFKSDVIGVGEHLYRYHHQEWKKLKDDLDNIYPTTKYDIKIKTKLKDVQAFLDSSKRRMKNAKK